jgi:hypothetical protein
VLPEPSPTERDAIELAALEAVIDRHLASFMEAGEALSRIRDGRLYRGSHRTWEDYCLERWEFTDRRARQLITAAKIGTTVPVANERQARALAPLKKDPEALSAAWREASSDGPPTFERVEAAVCRRLPQRSPVPGHLRTRSELAQKVQGLARSARPVSAAILREAAERLRREGD